MEQQPHRTCEWTKPKQKQNQVTSYSDWPRVLLFDLAHKQCNDIIKGWFHCLTPESVGRFLVNNMLMFDSAWCLVMVQIQFSLIKKRTIGRPEHSLLHSSVTRIFGITEKAPVVESLLFQITGEIAAFSNSVKNSNTYLDIFRKVTLLETSGNPLITGVAHLQLYS